MTMNFPQFIEKKYLEWQTKEGKRKSVEEFATYIGVSQSALSLWMGGKRTPSAQTVNLLAEIFGNGVYDALDLPRPNPYLQIVVRNWEFMSEQKQEQIARQIAEEAAKYEAKKSSERLPKTQKRGKAGGN
jgi:transcriptional regulator with XRE-family HTH domain